MIDLTIGLIVNSCLAWSSIPAACMESFSSRHFLSGHVYLGGVKHALLWWINGWRHNDTRHVTRGSLVRMLSDRGFAILFPVWGWFSAVWTVLTTSWCAYRPPHSRIVSVSTRLCPCSASPKQNGVQSWIVSGPCLRNGRGPNKKLVFVGRY